MRVYARHRCCRVAVARYVKHATRRAIVACVVGRARAIVAVAKLGRIARVRRRAAHGARTLGVAVAVAARRIRRLALFTQLHFAIATQACDSPHPPTNPEKGNGGCQ